MTRAERAGLRVAAAQARPADRAVGAKREPVVVGSLELQMAVK